MENHRVKQLGMNQSLLVGRPVKKKESFVLNNPPISYKADFALQMNNVSLKKRTNKSFVNTIRQVTSLSNW